MNAPLRDARAHLDKAREFLSAAAAVFAFRGFDALNYDVLPTVRAYTVVDTFFGVVDFVAVLTSDGTVEIVGFSDDPDYWTALGSLNS